MGIIESRTGKVIRPNKKSETHGYVKELRVEPGEDGENKLTINIEMNDL